MAKYRVWYSKNPTFRENPHIAWNTVDKTHIAVREVEAKDLDEVFYLQQGEIWSPNGEMRGFIRFLGLQHTSMSVGDVIEDMDDGNGMFYEVARVGFNPF